MAYRTIKTNITDSLNVVMLIERRPGLRTVAEVLEICNFDPGADRYNFKPVYVLQ